MTEQNPPTTVDRIQLKFTKFQAANPHIYDALVTQAREMKASLIERGKEPKVGINTVAAFVRWHSATPEQTEELKFPESLNTHYARLIMEREPDLAGFFRQRTHQSA
jgi:hypothetical protein